MLIPINVYTKNEWGSYQYETRLYLLTVPRKGEYINIKEKSYDVGSVWRVKFVKYVIEEGESRVEIFCTVEKYGYVG